jgi:uncharacterized protein YuzB (UPF0349 family)
MFYIVQENIWNESGYDNLINTLERLDLDYEIVKVLPFIEKFNYETKRKDVFCFGSIKLTRLASKNWNPGVLLNDNHNYLTYSKHWKDNLLNSDSIITKAVDLFFEGMAFIRPVLDNKSFNGILCTYEYYKEHIADLLEDTVLIQVAKPKVICSEYRFWIVDGKIVTYSQYKLGKRVIYSNYCPGEGIKFVERMIDIFQLAKAFVIDVCLLEDNTWKIVEAGCINNCGFYAADMNKLIIHLERSFN